MSANIDRPVSGVSRNQGGGTATESGWKRFLRKYELCLMLLVPLAWYTVFCYLPMYGLQIAFKDFAILKGIWGSDWVGLKHFESFFSSYYFWRLLKNTVLINVYALVVGFPIPIALAILINEIRGKKYQKFLQNITYMPHFLSVVVMVGMLSLFLSPTQGVVNLIIRWLGGDPIAFLERPEYFKSIYVLSDVWQNMGWNAIIYIAALSGIDPTYYEAAVIDGASRLQRIIHIAIPSIMPTIIILFILRMGHMMNVGFEKVFLLQNSLNKESSDVIATFVYHAGIVQGNFSFSAAVGLFNSLINFGLLILANSLSKRLSETSLW